MRSSRRGTARTRDDSSPRRATEEAGARAGSVNSEAAEELGDEPPPTELADDRLVTVFTEALEKALERFSSAAPTSPNSPAAASVSSGGSSSRSPLRGKEWEPSCSFVGGSAETRRTRTEGVLARKPPTDLAAFRQHLLRGLSHDSLREQTDAYKAQVVVNALSGSALRFIEDEAAGNPDAVASPEMVFAKLFDRFLDPSAAMAAAGQLFRLRIDDFVGEEGAPEATEAAEHFWRAHDNCLLLAGKVFGRNAAPKCIALFLSMPQEVQARLRETEVVKRCETMTIMGDAARERWRPGQDSSPATPMPLGPTTEYVKELDYLELRRNAVTYLATIAWRQRRGREIATAVPGSVPSATYQPERVPPALPSRTSASRPRVAGMPLSPHTRERVVNVMRKGYRDLPPAVRQAAWRGALCFNCFGPRADCGGVATCSRPAYSRASGEIAQLLKRVEGAAALHMFREAVPGEESDPESDAFEATLQQLEVSQLGSSIEQYGIETAMALAEAAVEGEPAGAPAP